MMLRRSAAARSCCLVTTFIPSKMAARGELPPLQQNGRPGGFSMTISACKQQVATAVLLPLREEQRAGPWRRRCGRRGRSAAALSLGPGRLRRPKAQPAPLPPPPLHRPARHSLRAADCGLREEGDSQAAWWGGGSQGEGRRARGGAPGAAAAEAEFCRCRSAPASAQETGESAFAAGWGAGLRRQGERRSGRRREPLPALGP